MIKYIKIYDISAKLGIETTCPSGGAAFETNQKEICFKGETFRGTFINMFVHAGSHVDAPSHLYPHKKTLDQYPLYRFILHATVVEIKQSKAIKLEHVKNIKIKKNHALLFKTDNSTNTLGVDNEYTYMTLDALEACIEKGVTLFGFDSWTAENPNGEGAPLHHRCFSADALILEGLNLNNVPEGHYMLVALPLNIEKVDGSPVRAVLLPKEVF